MPFFDNNINSVTVPNSVLENPAGVDGTACKYFDYGVNVTWNGNNYICI